MQKRSVLNIWCMVVLMALASGCIRNQIMVRVNADGSGDILVTRVLPPQVVQMIEQQLQQMQADLGAMAPAIAGGDMFYNEDALKRDAAWFGPDVVFVNSRKVERGGSRGYLVHYRFADVRRIILRPEVFSMESLQRIIDSADGFDDEPDGSSMLPPVKPDQAFTFAFDAGETSRLTVRPPLYPELPAADSEEVTDIIDDMNESIAEDLHMIGGENNPFGLTGKETPAEMFAKVYKDCELSVAVEVVGEVVASDARFADAQRPTRFTLLRVMPEQLAQAENIAVAAAAISSDNPLTFFSAMQALPASRIETNRAVTIEFK